MAAAACGSEGGERVWGGEGVAEVRGVWWAAAAVAVAVLSIFPGCVGAHHGGRDPYSTPGASCPPPPSSPAWPPATRRRVRRAAATPPPTAVLWMRHPPEGHRLVACLTDDPCIPGLRKVL